MASAFYGWDIPELIIHRDAYKAAVLALATAASYDMSVQAKDGVASHRALTRTDLPTITKTLEAIQAEIRRQQGCTQSRVGYANFAWFDT